MQIDWLRNIADGWQGRISENRLPHAVMLIGPAGTGKRPMATWMAQQRLAAGFMEPLPVFPRTEFAHPDLQWLRPLEDKQTIGVDQVRALVGELSLTSYEGGGKVAIVEPANALTVAAANSLLKTLEEPPGDALLVLIADRVAKLPATIFSRCQRINFNTPAEAASLAWLEKLQAGGRWPQALHAAGGAPLSAIKALDRLADTDSMGQDFAALADGRAAPLEVALRWSKSEPGFVLDWLSGQIQHCIQRASNSGAGGASRVVADSVLNRIDTRKLFCYLDMINRLRAQAAGSYNVQLSLEGLLIDWTECLSRIAEPGNVSTAKLSFLRG